jgi:hypothetical protein
VWKLREISKPDEYEVTLQDLSPMALLPSLLLDDATQGSAEAQRRLEEYYARAMPSQPRHGLQVLDALHTKLTALRPPEAWPPTLPVPPFVLPDAVAAAYNAVRSIWERANGEVYQARLDFQDGVAKIKSAILALDGLEARLYWDSVMAKAFDTAGIEWYGQFWRPQDIEECITSLRSLPPLSQERLREDWLSLQQGSWQDRLLGAVSSAYYKQGLDQTAVNRVDRALRYAILLLTNPTTAQGAAMTYARDVRSATLAALSEREGKTRETVDRAEEAAGGAYAIESTRFIDYSLISVLKLLMEKKKELLPSVMFHLDKKHQDELLTLALHHQNEWAGGHEEFLKEGIKAHKTEIDRLAQELNDNDQHLVDGLRLGIGKGYGGERRNVRPANTTSYYLVQLLSPNTEQAFTAQELMQSTAMLAWWRKCSVPAPLRSVDRCLQTVSTCWENHVPSAHACTCLADRHRHQYSGARREHASQVHRLPWLQQLPHSITLPSVR